MKKNSTQEKKSIKYFY